MTVLHPCHRCAHKSDCDRLSDLRARLRGAGITKGNVKCAIPQTDFPVGQPVSVRCFTLAWGEYGDDGYRRVPATRLGVVQRYQGGRFTVLLDVGQEVGEPDIGEPGSDARPIAIVRAYHDQLSLVEGLEAPVELCDCGLTRDRCKDPAKLPRLKSGAWQCWAKLNFETPAEEG